MFVHAVVTFSVCLEPSQICYICTYTRAAFTVCYFLSLSRSVCFKKNSPISPIETVEVLFHFGNFCADAPLFISNKIKQKPAIEYWIILFVFFQMPHTNTNPSFLSFWHSAARPSFPIQIHI